jgi:putative oxidoreductase
MLYEVAGAQRCWHGARAYWGRGMVARTIDAIAVRGEGLFLLLGRLAMGALFVPAGYRHLTNLSGFAQYLGGHGLPGPAMAWAIVGAFVEFFGSLAVLVGFKTRYAALALIAFTIGATLIGHPFWAAPEGQLEAQTINFFKNLAIIGGLLFVFVRGAGPISIDRR